MAVSDWCLHGTLPHARFPPPSKVNSGEAFVLIDRYLDKACTGPRYLQRPDIARIVVDSLHKGVELGQFELGAYCIMANHVHSLLLPKIHPSRLLNSMKGCTAREANRVLDRTGEPFWQGESYDHWVRSEDEYWRIVRYIEKNPVKAGLVKAVEDYRWSSAFTAEGR